MTFQRVVRRPARQPASYEPSPKEVAMTKNFNNSIRIVQGFVTSILANASPTQNVVFDAPGKFLLGIAFIPGVETFDISGVLATVTVNGINLIKNMAASNANPLKTQGMIFFPLPQPLHGNDQLNIVFNNTTAIAGSITSNFFYIPQGSPQKV